MGPDIIILDDDDEKPKTPKKRKVVKKSVGEVGGRQSLRLAAKKRKWSMGRSAKLLTRLKAWKEELNEIPRKKPYPQQYDNFAMPTTSASKIREFPGKITPMKVVVMREDECILINGAFEIMSIAGEASINRHVLKPAPYSEQNLVPVVSPDKCPACLSGRECILPEKAGRVESRVKELCPNDYLEIVELWQEAPTSTCILVLMSRVAPVVTILSQLYDHFIIPKSSTETMVLAMMNDYQPYDGESIGQIQGLCEHIQSQVEIGDRQSVVITGAANAGKSTFLRIFVNDFLSRSHNGDVWVLDCDIGQSEMSPSGCVTLTRIDAPILSPPFAHQPAHFSNAFLYGNKQIENPAPYYTAIERLIQEWKELSTPTSLLVVNTMGFIVAEGASALNHIFNSLHRPTAVTFVTGFGTYTPPAGVVSMEFHINTPNNSGVELKSKIGLSAQNRQQTMLGYFCNLLQSSCRRHLSSIASHPPFAIDFSAICLCFPEERMCIDDKLVLAAINCTSVALGYYDDEQKAEPTRRLFGLKSFPRIRGMSHLNSHPPRIVGFGLIRAVDVEKKKLYLLTPVPREKMEKVDCLIRPMDIDSLSLLITSQLGEIPYADTVKQQRGVDLQNDIYRPAPRPAFIKRNVAAARARRMGH